MSMCTAHSAQPSEKRCSAVDSYWKDLEALEAQKADRPSSSRLQLPPSFGGFKATTQAPPGRAVRPFIFYMADEEPVDPKKYLEELCKPKCVKPLLEYKACAKRIEGDDSGHKHCTGQYFDYWRCIDKRVALKLFEKLK